MPAREKKIIKKANAKKGLFLDKPDKSSIVSVYEELTLIKYKQEKAPKFITT